jgi:hypothetical protein
VSAWFTAAWASRAFPAAVQVTIQMLGDAIKPKHTQLVQQVPAILGDVPSVHSHHTSMLTTPCHALPSLQVRRSFDGSVDLAGELCFHTLWGEGAGGAWAAADGPADSSDSIASSRRASGQYVPAQPVHVGSQHQGAMTGRGGRGRHPAAHPVRASWNPGSSSSAVGEWRPRLATLVMIEDAGHKQQPGQANMTLV